MTKHSLFANPRLSEDTAYGNNFPYSLPPENEGRTSAKELARRNLQKQRRNQEQLESLQTVAVEEQKDDDENPNTARPYEAEPGDASLEDEEERHDDGFRAQLDALAKAIFGDCVDSACLRSSDHYPNQAAAQPRGSLPLDPSPLAQQQQQRQSQSPPPPPRLPGSGADGLPYGEAVPQPQHIPYYHAPPHPHYAYPPEPPPLSIADELRQLAAKAGVPFGVPQQRRGEAVPKFLGEDALWEDSDDAISAISAHTLEEMVRKQHSTTTSHNSNNNNNGGSGNSNNNNQNPQQPQPQGRLHPLCESPLNSSKTTSSNSSSTMGPQQPSQQQPLPHKLLQTQRSIPEHRYSSSSYQTSSSRSGDWELTRLSETPDGTDDPPSPTRTGSSSSGGK